MIKPLVILFVLALDSHDRVKQPVVPGDIDCPQDGTACSETEKRNAITYLNESLKELNHVIRDLRADQLNFRSAINKWSIKDNIEHLVKVERIVQQIVHDSLSLKPTHNLRSSISDIMLVTKSISRVTKFNAPDPIRPNNQYASTAEAFARV